MKDYGMGESMNYLQKLFINSVVDIYSDILCVDIESGDCSYIYTENKVMEEIYLPQKWDEAKQLILESIPLLHNHIMVFR